MSKDALTCEAPKNGKSFPIVDPLRKVTEIIVNEERLKCYSEHTMNSRHDRLIKFITLLVIFYVNYVSNRSRFVSLHHWLIFGSLERKIHYARHDVVYLTLILKVSEQGGGNAMSGVPVLWGLAQSGAVIKKNNRRHSKIHLQDYKIFLKLCTITQ